jgi:hypothetical protein
MFEGARRGVAATVVAVGLVALLAPAGRAATQDEPADVTPGTCDAYAGDPEPDTDAWRQRDLHNVACG